MSAFYSAVARFYDAETGDKTDDLALFSRLARKLQRGPHLRERLSFMRVASWTSVRLAHVGETLHYDTLMVT